MGQLKAKLAKLRRELLGPQGGGGGGGGLGFDVARTGIASVGFVGFPSVGKVRTLSLYDYPFSVNRSRVFQVDAHVETYGDALRGLRD